jgi:cation diffusion facilitator family transporter
MRAARGNRGGSSRTVALALAANVATALVKLAAALVTRSSALWAEAFHAFADSGNEVCLIIAERSSRRPADEQHPLGHGRSAYFWALIASLGVFAVGSVLSVRQGVQELIRPESTISFRVAYLVLAASFCFDGVSLIQAHAQMNAEAQALKRSFLEHLDLSSDPIARGVFAEDAAALVGNIIAFAGIALHQVTGSAVPEAVAAIVVGILLGVVAFQLTARNRDMLIGGQVSAAWRARIGETIAAQSGIAGVSEVLVTFLGPRRAWVVAAVALDERLNGAEVQALLARTEAVLKQGSPFIARVDLVPRGRP